MLRSLHWKFLLSLIGIFFFMYYFIEEDSPLRRDNSHQWDAVSNNVKNKEVSVGIKNAYAKESMQKSNGTINKNPGYQIGYNKSIDFYNQDEYADLIELVTPAVVNINTTQLVEQSSKGSLKEFRRFFKFSPGSPFNDFFKDFGMPNPNGDKKEKKVNSLGSGFIVSELGYVVTNYHVIKDASEIRVKLYDDKEYDATLIGYDEKIDLAVLKIDSKKRFKYLQFGVAEAMRVGYRVMAIGNPFGFGGTVTDGIISAKGRYIEGNKFTDFIQTNASINRGNSGGPLLNMKGEVIGINTAIYSVSGGSIGIGFSIPIDSAKNVIEQIIDKGKFDRAWLGVNVQNVDEQIAESLGIDYSENKGVYVSLVEKNSPAEKAGIRNDDIIIKIEDDLIDNYHELRRVIGKYAIGVKIKVSLLRKVDGEYIKIKKQVKLSEFPSEAQKLNDKNSKESNLAKQDKVKFLGISLVQLNKELRKKYKISDKLKGLLVLEVGSGTFSGVVQKGFIVEKINGISVNKSKDVKQILKSILARKEEVINVSLVLRRSANERMIISKRVNKESFGESD